MNWTASGIPARRLSLCFALEVPNSPVPTSPGPISATTLNQATSAFRTYGGLWHLRLAACLNCIVFLRDDQRLHPSDPADITDGVILLWGTQRKLLLNDPTSSDTAR